MWRIKSLFIPLILLVALGSACTQKQDIYAEKKVFRYNEPAPISSLDPAFARSHENIWACNHLYNGLLKMSDSLTVEPDLAKHYSVSEDGKVYTFLLRKEVFFHKHSAFGELETRAVNAHDFVYSFNRLIDPKTASPGSWVFSKVSGEPNAFYAINDTTLQITLSEPWPVFPSILTMKYCSVVPKEVVAFYGSSFRENPIGTGPFKLFLWKENSNLVLHKNENYFLVDSVLGQLPLLDAVSITFNQDLKSVYLSFLKGQYDFISGIDASFKDEVLTSSGVLREGLNQRFNLIKTPFLKVDYLGFNTEDTSACMHDLNFRKAINFAIDKDKMVKYLRNNIGVAAQGGFIPVGLPGFNYNKNIGYTYNLDSARYYLSRVSCSSKNSLVLSATASQADLCEFVQKELDKIDIKVKVNILPASHHREQTSAGNLSFFRKNWLADYPDAENFVGVFYSKKHPPNGPNYMRFSDSAFDDVYNLTLTESKDEARILLYKKADARIMELAPIVPLYYDEVVQLLSKKVKNYHVTPINLLDLSRVDLE
jgi:ABC-type transport system substrate-binding protein